jgi:hypothetical protein
MVRYRERAVLLRGSFQSRFEIYSEGDGLANKGDGGAGGLSERARIS